MAITATSWGTSQYGWAVNGYTADAQACEVIKAAPGAGVSLYVRRLDIFCAANISIDVGEADEADTANESVLVGPVNLSTINDTMSVLFNPPAKLTANKALCVEASGAGAVVVVAQGYTR